MTIKTDLVSQHLLLLTCQQVEEVMSRLGKNSGSITVHRYVGASEATYRHFGRRLFAEQGFPAAGYDNKDLSTMVSSKFVLRCAMG